MSLKGLLDRFRVEMTGRNWGVPCDFLHYMLGDFEQSHAISLLHDVLVRSWLEKSELTLGIWKLADDFGRRQARFLPYWNNKEFVKIETENCYASLYHHPENGVLMIISNLGEAKAKGNVSLILSKFTLLPNKINVIDGLSRIEIFTKTSLKQKFLIVQGECGKIIGVVWRNYVL